MVKFYKQDQYQEFRFKITHHLLIQKKAVKRMQVIESVKIFANEASQKLKCSLG